MSSFRFSNHLLKIFCILFFFPISFAYSQDTNLTVAFADAIMQRYANINDLTHKGWEYSNSIVLTGIEKVYYETGDKKYLDYIKKYVDSYVSANGNITFSPTANNLDNLHPGWLCITLYQETGLEKYKTAARKIRAEFDNQPRNDSGGFWHKQNYPNQMWADGIYMAEPFLMRYGATFGELDYASDEATKQAILLANHAYDSVKNLLYHGWDETREAIWANSLTGCSPEVWSRAMGWYCMALVDMLDYLPKTHKNYNRLLEILQGLATGIKTTRDADSSLWYQVVDKGNSAGNWIETSGSAMFIYALKKSVRKGYIDTSYNSVINKAWTALKSRVTFDESNLPVINDFAPAMGIKSSYDEYIAQTRVSTPPSFHPHGYCGFLLAGSEMEFKMNTKFQVVTSVIGSGSILQEPSNYKIDSGSTVTLTALPAEGYSFDAWEGDIVSADNPVSFTLQQNITLTAHFTEDISPVSSTLKKSNIMAFPTVATDYITLQVENETSHPVRVEIVNALGEPVEYTKKTLPRDFGNNIQLDVSRLSAGIYMIAIWDNEGLMQRKWIVKK